ncbi:hypothetical protein [Rhodococcus sp. WAY2]|uniref:hypothetical protein n=1 Tax=Rhodococcus sp. WAY2 TaxID=2663121 RepID=UPI00131F95AA|nr:hypothetical protein [Rhodococcus sp. WAY2]QHE72868.1 hypothetical protein GFS60_06517 [Rhodococcus sp. WAY2]
MRRWRWPALAPPATGGNRVHGPSLLAASPCVRLELSEIVAYPSGMQLLLALTATDISAQIACHETRALTDRNDFSAHWSYLTVQIGVDDLHGEADPYCPVTTAAGSGTTTFYRTVPGYWIRTPTSGVVTLTAAWPLIGLEPITTTLGVATVVE